MSEQEYLSRESLRALQSERLVRLVARLYQHVPFYRERMHAKGVSPADIRGIEDLPKLPLQPRMTCGMSTPSVFWQSPDGNRGDPCISGTTGKPVIDAIRGTISISGER